MKIVFLYFLQLRRHPILMAGIGARGNQDDARLIEIEEDPFYEDQIFPEVRYSSGTFSAS